MPPSPRLVQIMQRKRKKGKEKEKKKERRKEKKGNILCYELNGPYRHQRSFFTARLDADSTEKTGAKNEGMEMG